MSETLSPTECPESTNALGDWYCNLVRFGRSQVIICVSAQSYLMVMLPAAPAKEFGKRMNDRLYALLRRMDVPAEQAEAEIGVMQIQCYGKTQNRVKVGVMNQMVLDLGWHVTEPADEQQLTELEMHISKSLYGGPNYTWPGPETKKLLAQRWGKAAQLP